MEEAMGEPRKSFGFGIRNKIIDFKFKPDSAQAANNLPGRNFASITNEFTGIELIQDGGVHPRVKISTKLEGNRVPVGPNTTLGYDLANISELKFTPSEIIPAKGVNEPAKITPAQPIFNNFLGFTTSLMNNEGKWGGYVSAGPEWSPHLGESRELMPKIQVGLMKRIMENMYMFFTGSFKGVPGDKPAERSIQAGFLFNTMK
jgi:hypothetical protein